ncbi:uncharacterized protein LOC124493356 [Dermatophagoides farinae]|uniref:uncharacterized protein LOC124493356 n=1 Tax=Dermatophagoides farinae TaxID=6954 RepID=UPI003F5FBD04
MKTNFCLFLFYGSIIIELIVNVQTKPKTCFELRQEIINHIVAVGPFFHDNYLIFLTNKWIAYNTTINSLIGDIQFDLLTDTEIHDFGPVMNKFISLRHLEKMPISIYLPGHTCDNNNDSELIVTFVSKIDHLYRTYRFDFDMNHLILNVEQSRTNRTYQKIIINDCHNRTILMDNGRLYLLDHNENHNRYNICVQRSNIDRNRMEIGSTINECNDIDQSKLIFSNVRSGFLVSNTGQLYLISKDYLLIFTHNTIIDHDKYFVLTTKSFYEWLDCGDYSYIQQSQQSMNDADRFVSTISGLLFLFFLIYSLFVFYFMFKSNKSSSTYGNKNHNRM